MAVPHGDLVHLASSLLIELAVFSYSMYLIHKLGAQQMRLRFFGDDPTLGLRPFGLTAFHLTLVYLYATVYVVVTLNLPPLPGPYLLSLTSIFLVAIPLFLLPLRTLHRQLLLAKSKELDWIGKRYAETYSAIKAAGDAPLTESLKSDLVTIRQLQEDVRRVHDWPFDSVILARLIAVIGSILVALLSAYIQSFLAL